MPKKLDATLVSCKTYMYLISSRPVVVFLNLMPAMPGKWTTTHKGIFFSSKDCSWTLLPGLITQLYLQSNIRAYFGSLKRADNLSMLHDGSSPPGRHTRYFKTMLQI